MSLKPGSTSTASWPLLIYKIQLIIMEGFERKIRQSLHRVAGPAMEPEVRTGNGPVLGPGQVGDNQVNQMASRKAPEHQLPHNPPGVKKERKKGLSRCHWLTVTLRSSGHFKALLSLCSLYYLLLSYSLSTLEKPPAAELQLAVSGSLLAKTAALPFLTAMTRKHLLSNKSHSAS